MSCAATPDNPLPPIGLKPVGIDDWAEIRALHAFAFKRLIAPLVEAAQAEAYVEWIASPDYTDVLMTHDLTLALHENRIVGTAGWVPTDGSGASARITAVFVSPLYQRLGIGRMLVEAAEVRSIHAGFETLTTRVLADSVGFFETLGYLRSAQGVHGVGTENGIPVTFMRKLRQPATRRIGISSPGLCDP